jgi:LuxR family transcriptional regulator, maltose regulon positive regulatory protein
MSGTVMPRTGGRPPGPAADVADRGLPFALLESKLRLPPGLVGLVTRATLIEELEAASAATPLVLLSAGAGWGKTTLLTQWAVRSSRPFAWVSADANDNDPIVLLTYVAAALDRVTELDAAVFEALGSPGISIEAAVLPRLGAALARIDGPVVLVLDDLHRVDARRSLDAVAALAGHVPPGSQLVLSARGRPELPLATWRTRGHAVEIGHDDLRMSVEEASFLLSSAGADLDAPEVARLTDSTEGWPAGLYLAALSVRARRGSRGDPAAFAGSDRLVADYLRSELLAYLPAEELRFLTRTAVLEQLSGPLCDAVLDTSGSTARLDDLEDANLFVVPLDRDRSWWRYHHLFRELLRSELERSEPELVAVLLQRAADWSAANGRPEDAIAYAQEAGDIERVTRLLERCALATYQSGRAATAARWLDWVERHDAAEHNAAVAVLGAIMAAVQGRAADSDRWADAARRGARDGRLADGSESIEAWLALLAALRCRDGVSIMRHDAERAVRLLGRRSPFRPTALLLSGFARWLTGDAGEADDLLADAVEEGFALPAPEATVAALAQRALIAIDRGEWPEAEAFVERAVRIVHSARMTEYPTTAFVCAVAAHVALHRAAAATANELLARAQRLRPGLTYALPHLAVLTRVELARTYLLVADVSGALTVMREIDALIRRQPDLGRLIGDVEELHATLRMVRVEAPGASTLTAAELRVLPLLTTHLSFREIGDRLYLSRHTVKSHAMAVYRKLNVTSRDGAVQRAQELGLL